MSTSQAAHKPSDLEAKFHGQTRDAHGYQYWTTSEEDEESVDDRERFARGSDDSDEGKKKRKRVKRAPLLPKGTLRRTALRIASLLLIATLAAIGYFIFNYVQVSSAAGEASTVTEADAIVVLGAAQYNGSPSAVLQERLDHAFNLYNQGVAPVIMTTGAGQDGDVTTEGLVGLNHLRDRGVPESDILVIPEGTNSWEQLSASQFQMEQHNFADVILVSDDYHSYRLLAIADELGIEASVSPSLVEGTVMNTAREAAAVSIGRITGYRRLSAFTEDG